MILCIETATSVCSVALAHNGNILSVRESREEKAHASNLGVFIKQVLTEANTTVDHLDAVAVSKGPGSYTGLRIGVSMAKGLCYGAGLPLIALETLKIMSYGMKLKAGEWLKKGRISDAVLFCPMIDARRMEVYTAVFDINIEKVQETAAIIVNGDSFDQLLSRSQVIFAGSGAMKCKTLIKHKNALFMDDYVHSAMYMKDMVQLAYQQKKFENRAYFEPFYLKDFIVTTSKKRVL